MPTRAGRPEARNSDGSGWMSTGLCAHASRTKSGEHMRHAARPIARHGLAPPARIGLGRRRTTERLPTSTGALCTASPASFRCWLLLTGTLPKSAPDGASPSFSCAVISTARRSSFSGSIGAPSPSSNPEVVMRETLMSTLKK